LADKGELGANLTGAWSPRIALSPMMTRRAVAHFGNGFDESLRSLFFAPKLREPPLPLPPCRKVSHSLHSNGC
jgi:hypothetical protein